MELSSRRLTEVSGNLLGFGRPAFRGVGLLPTTIFALGLTACVPQPLESLVQCEGLPASMCDQLTPSVIDTVPSSGRSSVIEIRIVCSLEVCTTTEGVNRAWVRLADGSERELPDGQWASG